METLIGLGLKSLLIAGVTLGLLYLTRRRSAADRSWIAHLGLFALVALPLASLALPAMHVALPEALSPSPTIVEIASPATISGAATGIENIPEPVATPVAVPGFDWAPYAYAAPAAALLFITLLALLRLVALRHRAQVLVDPIWLSALAHAQRRMGFKNGTALLTSNELSSPISWGLMRPVILLNDEAIEASGEAEAIIAHELAHVARLDWAKLMLARVATAIFWFNPLAWILAREAHQLHEEAADDAVLAANIADTDYAQLLVGVARHECKGLLLGAHGISPGKGSLRRRVRRVLDGTLARGPAHPSWVAGFAAGMLVMAAPLAALTFAPKDELPEDSLIGKKFAEGAPPRSAPAAGPKAGPTIDQIVSTTVAGAVAATVGAAHPHPDEADNDQDYDIDVDADVDADVDTDVDIDLGANGKIRIKRNRSGGSSPVDDAIAMKIHGITPEYAASIRAAAPQLARLDNETLVGFKIHGVTPALVRGLNAQFRGVNAETITASAIHGITPEYVREMARAGYPGLTLDQLVTMRIHGVTPAFIARFKRAGYPNLTANQVVQMKIHGVDPSDLRESADPDP